MKKIVFTFLVLSCSMFLYAQNLDKKIKDLSENVAQKVSAKKKIRLALGDLVNNSGKADDFTNYIGAQVETNLINSDAGLEILDRKHLKQLLSDNHLQSEGLIDETTAKSSVAFVKVDGWVLGEITSFENQFKITIKVIDVSTSIILASVTSDPISNSAIQQFQEARDRQNGIIPECEKYQFGDFCFANRSNYLETVSIFAIFENGAKRFINNITLEAGKTQCVYKYKAGAYYYSFRHSRGDYDVSGQFTVVACKSQALTIEK